MTKKAYFIWTIIILLVNVLTLPYAWQLVNVIFASGSILDQLALFKWAAAGFALFFIVRRFLKGNLELAETFSHEFTHLVVGGLINRELYEMQVKRRSGVVWSAGKSDGLRLPMTLSPYCFPIFTFMLLSFRWMITPQGLWVFDSLVGVTLCFHFYCFKNQLHNGQDDINQHPLAFSYAYIVTSWILMFCLIVPSFFPTINDHYGVFGSIWQLLQAWWGNIIAFIHYL